MKILSIKNFFNIFLVVFFLAGSILSVNVGISHDEWHEEQNWKFNLEVVENSKDKLFSNKIADAKNTIRSVLWYWISIYLSTDTIIT